MQGVPNPTETVQLETPTPDVRRVLECPPRVRELIESQATGIRRVVISVVSGRNNATKLNAIRILGAESSRRPTEDQTDHILELIMRVVSAQLEESGQGETIRIVPYHATDKPGASGRGRGQDVPFSGMYDAAPGESPQTAEQSEMLRYLAQQNRHTLNVLEQVPKLITAFQDGIKAQAEYNGTIVGRLTDALTRERDAVDRAAEARIELETAARTADLDREKLQQRGQLIEMLKPMIGQAAGSMGLKAAELLTPAKPKTANPLSKPSGKAEPTATAKPTADPETTPPAAEQAEPAATDDPHAEIKESHPEAYNAARLYDSLTEEQRAAIEKAIGPEAWQELECAGTIRDNAKCLEHLAAAIAAATDGGTEELMGILSPKQQTVIGSLMWALENQPAAEE